MLKKLDSLFDCARNSSTAEDFASRLDTPGFLSGKAKEYKQKIRDIVEQSGPSGVDDEKFWCFFKAIHILLLDFSQSVAQQEAICKQQLAQTSSSRNPVRDAETTWNELLSIATNSASGARKLCRSDLPEDLRTLHNAVPTSLTDLQKLTDHSDTTLNSIQTTIAEVLTLPRRETVTRIIDALAEKQVVILSGPAGYGKSALAKAVVQQQANLHTCLSFRAEEFARDHIDNVLPGSITSMQFERLVGTQKRVLLHVESLERLLENATRAAFTDLVEMVRRLPNFQLLLTCRDYSTDIIVSAFLGSSTYETIEVKSLHEKEMVKATHMFPPLAIPMSNSKLAKILRIPHYLDMIVKMYGSGQQDMPQNIKALREKYWSDAIRKDDLTTGGLPDRREQALVELAIRRARKLQPYVPTDGIDVEALSALHHDGIILRERSGSAAPTHDVIEDWAILHWVESLITKHEWQSGPISQDIGEYPAIRRGFREWLKEALNESTERADPFVLAAYGDDSLPRNFQDDVMVSVLLAHSARNFILRQRERMLADDAWLLTRMMHLTRVACKKTPKQIDVLVAPPSIMLEPEGKAWSALLEIVADELDCLLPTHFEPILGLLEDWSRGIDAGSPMPGDTITVDQIVSRLLRQCEDHHNTAFLKRVLMVVVRAPNFCKNSFISLDDRASTKPRRRGAISDEFVKLLISGTDGNQACRDFPERMCHLTLFQCCIYEQDPARLSRIDTYSGTELDFGLYPEHHLSFFPQSAIRGPFLYLLTHHPDIGIRLVLDLVNHAGDWYANRRRPRTRLEPARLITILIPGGGEVKQWANDRLWHAYRGLSVTPFVIQCALMALEFWLLDKCKNSISVESLLLKILRESNNVMTTAVVASVCTAYVNLCGNAVFALLKSKECIELDHCRLAKERESNAWFTGPRLGLVNELARMERKKSNAMQHRQQDLEYMILNLQHKETAESVWSIIDDYLTKVPDEAHRTEDDRLWLLALHRMDLRRWEIDRTFTLDAHGSKNKTGNSVSIPLVIRKMDPDLQGFVDSQSRKRHQFEDIISLCNWGSRQWEQSSKKGDADSWQNVLASARKEHSWEFTQDGKPFLEGCIGIVAAVCVRDHLDEMSDDDRQWCIDKLVAEVGHASGNAVFYAYRDANPMNPDRYAAWVLPKILARDPANTDILKAVACAITHASSEVSMWASEGVAVYLTPEHRSLAQYCMGTVAMHSNRLVQSEQRQIQMKMQGFPNKTDDLQAQLQQIRNAFVQETINVKQELARLDLTSWQGRYAFQHILTMSKTAPNWSHTKDLFTAAGQYIVDAGTADHEDPNAERDFEFEQFVIGILANIVLFLPPREAMHYCKPFLDAVERHPDEVAHFIETLILEEEKFSNTVCFWDVWQAFANRVISASWSSRISSSHSTGMEIVDRILLGHNMMTKRSWSSIVDNECRLDKFTASLPAVSPILTSFVHYLHSAKKSSLPDAFIVIADFLRRGNPTDILGSGNIIFYLESLLQPYVYRKPILLKTEPTLRKAVLAILNDLVDAGSSAAYKMRDDFVTPGGR